MGTTNNESNWILLSSQSHSIEYYVGVSKITGNWISEFVPHLTCLLIVRSHSTEILKAAIQLQHFDLLVKYNVTHKCLKYIEIYSMMLDL